MRATPVTTPDPHSMPIPRTPHEAAVRYAQQIRARRQARAALDAIVACIEAARPAPYLAPCVSDLFDL